MAAAAPPRHPSRGQCHTRPSWPPPPPPPRQSIGEREGGATTMTDHYNNDSHTVASVATTASVNTLAAFLVESGSHQDDGFEISVQPSSSNHPARRRRSLSANPPFNSLEVQRRRQMESQAVINALNHFILQAGNIYRGKKLSDKETTQLVEAASQVGLSMDVVDALVEQTSNPRAVVEYCLSSDDAFARRINQDPYLQRILTDGKNHKGGDGGRLNLTSSIWRVFMHKIIHQFLKQQNLCLVDVMDPASLTSRLYEEAFRDDPHPHFEDDANHDHHSILADENAPISRDYTKERERIMISESEMKQARLEADANVEFRRRKLFEEFTTDRASNRFQPHEAFRESRYDDDDDDLSLLAPGAEQRIEAALTTPQQTPTQDQIRAPRRRQPSDSWIKKPNEKIIRRGEKENARKTENSTSRQRIPKTASAVKRAMAVFEKGVSSSGIIDEKTDTLPRGKIGGMGRKSMTVSKTRAIFEGVVSFSASEETALSASSTDNRVAPKRIRKSLVESFNGNQPQQLSGSVSVQKPTEPTRIDARKKICQPVESELHQPLAAKRENQNLNKNNEGNDALDSVFEIGTNHSSIQSKQTGERERLPETARFDPGNSVSPHDRARNTDPTTRMFELVPYGGGWSELGEKNHSEHDTSRFPVHSSIVKSDDWVRAMSGEFEQQRRFMDDESSAIPAPPTKRDSILVHEARWHANDSGMHRQQGQQKTSQPIQPSRSGKVLKAPSLPDDRNILRETTANFATFESTNELTSPPRQDKTLLPTSSVVVTNTTSTSIVKTIQKRNRPSRAQTRALENAERGWERFDVPFQHSNPSSLGSSRHEEQEVDIQIGQSQSSEDNTHSSSVSCHYFEKLLTQEIDPPIQHSQSSSSYPSVSTQQSTALSSDHGDFPSKQGTTNQAGAHVTTREQWEDFKINYYSSTASRQIPEIDHRATSTVKMDSWRSKSIEITSSESNRSELTPVCESSTATSSQSSIQNYSDGTSVAMAQLSYEGQAFIVRSEQSSLSSGNECSTQPAEERNLVPSIQGGREPKKRSGTTRADEQRPPRTHHASVPHRNEKAAPSKIGRHLSTEMIQQKIGSADQHAYGSVQVPQEQSNLRDRTTISHRPKSVPAKKMEEVTRSTTRSNHDDPADEYTPVVQLSEIEALEEFRQRRESTHVKEDKETAKARRIEETIRKLASQGLNEGQTWASEYATAPRPKTGRKSIPPPPPSQPARNPRHSYGVSRNQPESKWDDHQRGDMEEASLEIAKSSSTLSNMLRVDTASSSDIDEDDVGLNSPSDQIRRRSLAGPFSRSPYYSSDVRNAVTEEEEIRAAAKQNGIPSPVIDIILHQSRNTEDQARTAQVLIQQAKYDSDTGLPASARHLYSYRPAASASHPAIDSFGGNASPTSLQSTAYHLAGEEHRPDPSPESRRESDEAAKTEVPESVSKEEMALLNNFIEVASGNFGVQKLSTESESRLRAAAHNVGLTPKFVDQILKQAQVNSQSQQTERASVAATTLAAGAGPNPFPRDSTDHNDQQQPTHHPNQYHQYPPPENTTHGHYPHHQYYPDHNEHIPNRFPQQQSPSYHTHGGEASSQYYTVDLTQTTRRTKKTQSTEYDNCNVWESLSKNLGWLGSKCGVTGNSGNTADDASSISSAASWDDKRQQQQQQQRQRDHHKQHRSERSTRRASRGDAKRALV